MNWYKKYIIAMCVGFGSLVTIPIYRLITDNEVPIYFLIPVLVIGFSCAGYAYTLRVMNT